MTWTFEADAAALPGPRKHDAVGCDPGQRFWAVLANAQQSHVIAAPRSPWQVPDSLPPLGCMLAPVDLRRARAELAYHMAEAARPQRDELLTALLAYDSVGIEDVDWQGLEQRHFSFSPYAAATGLRAVLETATELGPQLGCVVIRTPSRLSSRTCSACGRVAPGRGYGRRMYHCPRCGLTVDRDINAARNHRQAALAAVGT